MKKLRLFLAAIAVALFAPALIAADAELVKELERTQAKLLASVEGLSEAQWNYKPAPDRWSVAETFEHITTAEPFIRAMVAKSLETPAKEGSKKDEMVLTGVVDRSKKFKAPEPLQPAHKFASAADAVAAYKKERAETIKLAGSEADFRAQGSDHFIFGPLDSHGWGLFLSAHSERHTLQIEEVKASEGFPKN
jgi:DinB superfamily